MGRKKMYALLFGKIVMWKTFQSGAQSIYNILDFSIFSIFPFLPDDRYRNADENWSTIFYHFNDNKKGSCVS